MPPARTRLTLVIFFGLVSIVYLVFTVQMFRPVSLPMFPPAELEQHTVCGSSYGSQVDNDTIYFITPTYTRREQIAELTRLGQTLLLADKLHWVVAEDSNSCSQLVSSLLQRFGIPYTHISSPQPEIYRTAKLKLNPRGVSSRRAGLHWVLNNSVEGIVYFADDDNTYDYRLFREISRTNRISMFPVGFIGGQGVSAPIVKEGEVIGFTDDWFAQRKWPVDMAGFAIRISFLKSRNPRAETAMPYKAGFEEDIFLRSLRLSLKEIEPLATNCTQVLVWHTQTKKEKKAELYLRETEQGSSLSNLFTFLTHAGMANVGSKGKHVRACYGGHQCKTGS